MWLDISAPSDNPIMPKHNSQKKGLAWFVDEISEIPVHKLDDGTLESGSFRGDGVNGVIASDPRDDSHTFMRCSQEAGILLRRHWHNQTEIVMIREGKMVLEQAVSTRILNPGDALIIPPRVPHSAYAITDSKYVLAYFPAMGLRWEKQEEKGHGLWNLVKHG